jgi:hypothetical protein
MVGGSETAVKKRVSKENAFAFNPFPESELRVRVRGPVGLPGVTVGYRGFPFGYRDWLPGSLMAKTANLSESHREKKTVRLGAIVRFTIDKYYAIVVSQSPRVCRALH